MHVIRYASLYFTLFFSVRITCVLCVFCLGHVVWFKYNDDDEHCWSVAGHNSKVRPLRGRYKRTLQQDRTTRVITHRSKHYHAPACGVRISPDTWPPTSRTTDLVDYVVWSPTGASPVTAENVTVDRLKKAIVLEWRRLSERFNDHNDQWMETSSAACRASERRTHWTNVM